MTRTKYRWFIVFLLFAITAVNYIDRAAISYAIPMMQRDLGLSPADTGIILGAFGMGYAITTLIGGFAVDRYGPRLVLTVAAILWSLSIGTTALAGSFAVLYAARVLLGVSEGPNFPALTGAVSHWLSPHERATALGNALLAVPLALAVGGPIVTQLLGWLDWRLTFAALFILSVAWVPLWYFLFRDNPADSRFVNAAELAYIRTSDPSVSATPHAVPNSWPEPGVLGAADQPDAARQHLGLLRLRLFPVFLHDLAAELPGAGLWPQPADRRPVHRVALARGRGPAVAARALVGPSPEDDGPAAHRPLLSHRRQPVHRRAGGHSRGAHQRSAVAIAGITVAVAASMGANAAYYAVNVDIVPHRAATALGIMDFAFAIAGFLAPAITGWVLDLRGSFVDGFLLMTGLALSSVLVVLLFHHPDRDRRNPALQI